MTTGGITKDRREFHLSPSQSVSHGSTWSASHLLYSLHHFKFSNSLTSRLAKKSAIHRISYAFKILNICDISHRVLPTLPSLSSPYFRFFYSFKSFPPSCCVLFLSPSARFVPSFYSLAQGGVFLPTRPLGALHACQPDEPANHGRVEWWARFQLHHLQGAF